MNVTVEATEIYFSEKLYYLIKSQIYEVITTLVSVNDNCKCLLDTTDALATNTNTNRGVLSVSEPILKLAILICLWVYMLCSFVLTDGNIGVVTTQFILFII